MAPAVLLALLVAQAPPPDLAVRPPPLQPPRGAALGDAVGGGEIGGALLGVVAGDAAVLGLAYATYQAFVSGATAPTAAHFRHAAIGLAASAVILPPLGAALGGALGRSGPTRGGFWKAFLLATLGHAASLAAGYLVAPAYWVILPVQLSLMTTGVAFGLHLGPPLHRPAADAGRPPAAAPGLAFLPPVCPDG